MRVDGVHLATVYLALLFLVPARYVLPGLGAAGRPAALIGLGGLVLWAMNTWHGRPKAGPCSSAKLLRAALLAWLLTCFLSYVVAVLRQVPAVELRSADRALLTQMGLVGIALVLSETQDGARVRQFARRLVLFASVMALVGLLQSFTGFDPVRSFRIPGLVLNNDLLGTRLRGDGGLVRVGGTATHYIEFSVVLGMVLPLALHWVLYPQSKRTRIKAAGMAIAIAIAIPLAISRAGVLTAAVAMTMLAVVWRPRMLLVATVGALPIVLLLQVVRPGLLGTIRSLFVNAGQDPSIIGRTRDYDVAATYFERRPWLGRGLGTFLPDRYLLLDNDWLGVLMAMGLLGVIALLALLGVAVLLAALHGGQTRSGESRHFSAAIAAGVVGAAVALGTFDGLGFPTFSGTLFVLLGCLAAQLRSDREMPTAEDAVTRLTRGANRRVETPTARATG